VPDNRQKEDDMAEIFYDKDAEINTLSGKTLAIIGYGSQGHAHAQNLRDSGCEVIVGEAAGSPGWEAAETAGFPVMSAAEASAKADLMTLLVPDTVQPKIYETELKANLTAGKSLVFAHGFNIHFGYIKPSADTDVFMIAPKGPGNLVRSEFTEGGGVPCLVAVHQDASGEAMKNALAYANGIGGTRAGVIKTTFEEETETDLFGEQAVLCGGAASLVKTGFEVLVEAGYQPEIAYFECMHELKLIVDLFYQGGLTLMWKSVSDTAEYGGLTVGPQLINPQAKKFMKEKILARVRSGEFAKEWVKEFKQGCEQFNRLEKADAEHQLEVVGAKLRKMMSWIGS